MGVSIITASATGAGVSAQVSTAGVLYHDIKAIARLSNATAAYVGTATGDLSSAGAELQPGETVKLVELNRGIPGVSLSVYFVDSASGTVSVDFIATET